MIVRTALRKVHRKIQLGGGARERVCDRERRGRNRPLSLFLSSTFFLSAPLFRATCHYLNTWNRLAPESKISIKERNQHLAAISRFLLYSVSGKRGIREKSIFLPKREHIQCLEKGGFRKGNEVFSCRKGRVNVFSDWEKVDSGKENEVFSCRKGDVFSVWEKVDWGKENEVLSC